MNGVHVMKVLQVNCVYKKGSTGKITYDLHRGLQAKGIESVVCYGRGELLKEPGIYKTCPEWYSKLNNAWSRITGIMYDGCFFSTNRLISIIKKEQPDIVHLQCINGYFVNIYRLVNWLKKHHQKTVLTLHAEFMYTGGCGHSIDCNQWSTRTGCGHSTHCPRWRAETKSLFFDRTAIMWSRMKDAFDGFDELIVTSVSPWLMERAKQSPILADREHCVVLNGLDTEIFHLYDTAELREKMGLTGKKVVFHATPAFSTSPDHIKGGHFIIELARRMPEVTFLVAGPVVGEISAPANLVLLGRVNDQKLLAQYYSMADVTVLTSKRETFSMVTAESLCCGTPVVGFKAGGPETIALEKMGSFLAYGDLDGMMRAIQDVLGCSVEYENNAPKVYSKQQMVNSFIECYKKLER